MFRSFGKRAARFLPRLEVLEDRLAPATRFWDGGATSNNWTSANNWSSNVAPVAGDDLVFPSNVSDKTADNNFAGGTLFNSITLGGGYTLRGNQVRLGSGGIVSQVSSNVINNDVNIGTGSTAPQVILVNAGSTLFIDGNIVGDRDLHKTGGGDLSFRANNDYSGVTDILAGRLFFEKDEGLGTFNPSAGTIIRGGATLVVNDNALFTIRTDEPITIHGGGTIHAVNDAHLRGSLATLGTATFRHDGGVIERLLVTGQISGPGGITIANASGQVLFQGSAANTYQGLTTVSGKLRLDHVGTAVPGNLTITSTGKLRLERDAQIGDDALVTVSGAGEFFGNGKNDTFRKLKLQGGYLDGYVLENADFTRPLLEFRNFGQTHSSFNVEEFEATSTSATQSAEILDVGIVVPTARILNGPAFNDFINGGFVRAFDPEEEETRLILEGGGTMLLTGNPAERYIVNEGLLRMNRFERNTLLDLAFIEVEVEVNAGGRFAGEDTIAGLLVRAGGRVRPGPLSSTGRLKVTSFLTLEPGAILEVTLNGGVAGIGHDQIDVIGSSTFDSHVTVDGAIVEPTLGPNASVGQQFRIINNSESEAIIGQFFLPPATAPFQNAPPTGQQLSFNYSGGFLNNDLVLTLQNTPPMAPGLAIDRTVIDEGGTVKVAGHLVDPDPSDRLRLLINWGDGTPVQTLYPGRADFTFRHRYLDEGQYVASFVWLDQHGQGNRREFSVTVNNVPPAAFLDLRLHDAAPLLFASLVVHDPSQDQLLLTVEFGDGTPARDFTLGKRRSLAFRHRFAQPGSYNLTLTLRDGDGGVTTLQRQVTI